MSLLLPRLKSRRVERRRRPSLLDLEARCLLSAGVVDDPSLLLDELPAIPAQTAPLYPRASDEYQGYVVAATATTTKNSLSAVPALNSLPGAKATIYLNFSGDFTASYGQYSSISTPAYDQDGDPTTFSDSELASIRQIWSYVAEDYAPFNVNVTTVAPANMGHGATQKVDIGGDGSWTHQTVGGLCYVNSFTAQSLPNISFVFPGRLANGDPKYTGDAASHEAGHGFGLEHQSKYSGSALVAEYYSGPGTGVAPLMGNSYLARRSIWWSGPSDVSSTTIQNDESIISSANNGFSFRQVASSSAASPLPLAIQGGTSVGASGLIVLGQQQDFYRLDVGAGQTTIKVSVPADVNNLSPVVTLTDASGTTTVATATVSTTDFSATLDVNLAAGSYRLVVSGGGQYGNVGTYSISGTIVAPSTTDGGGSLGGSLGGSATVAPVRVGPSRLAVTTVDASRVGISWSDVPDGAGFLVDRSTDGVSWGVLAAVGPGLTTFLDANVLPSTTYFYRVRTAYPDGGTPASPTVQATTAAAAIPFIPAPPAAVGNVSVVSRQAQRVVLTWTPSTSPVSGYQVERSTNGKRWTVVGQVSAPTTDFADATVAANRAYTYRIRAVNPYGLSPASRTLRVTTPRQVVHLMRRKWR
ncbi:Fibronectin type III domain protein [Aquisphaera giovannonii]|uniref:Fibronectin type III domain protein n=1 Tax=Aquisphaera giovannonii TaxID=406548 RepID=A0A5B9WCU5_9BACT|nr:fibronectin type III domain-containing protein [Aquisphaera giovannonii]QEH37700.1 Fibronectin type III domain protein [Aquisphaera giovannonii]